MSVLNRCLPVLLLASVAAGSSTAYAAGSEPAGSASSAAPVASTGFEDRLFLSFFQDAAIVKSQWWEGQLEFDDGSSDIPTDATVVRGVVAFRPYKQLEVGGRVGFGSTSASGNRPDGTGGTDLDAYAKWVFPNVSSNLDFAAGALVTVPTGDDTVGLGFNSFAFQVFGSTRYRLKAVELGGNVGLRFNGDGKFQGHDLAGKSSFEIAGSAVFPLANHVSVVTELALETDRFEQQDASVQVLGGVNWRAFGRGMLRGALAAGLTSGAPDFRVILGYAYTF